MTDDSSKAMETLIKLTIKLWPLSFVLICYIEHDSHFIQKNNYTVLKYSKQESTNPWHMLGMKMIL